MEFALVAPMLIMLVLGITDFGLMYNNSSVFANASRDAARAGSFLDTAEEIEDVVDKEVRHLPSIVGWTTDVSCTRLNGTACGSAYNDEKESGGTVTVVITYTYKWLTPSILGLPITSTIIKTSQMRIE